jgi:hypothetical protein
MLPYVLPSTSGRTTVVAAVARARLCELGAISKDSLAPAGLSQTPPPVLLPLHQAMLDAALCPPFNERADDLAKEAVQKVGAATQKGAQVGAGGRLCKCEISACMSPSIAATQEHAALCPPFNERADDLAKEAVQKVGARLAALADRRMA